MKKILLLFAAMCCMVANAAGTQPSGEGTSANPYQIATKDNLLWFAEHANQENLTACAILTADITVNNGVLDSNGDLNSGTFETWTPIGRQGNSYSGEFDGNGHTISGLYVYDASMDCAALFGKIGSTAYIHDLGVKDSYFRGNIWVAGICGDFASGKIENCWNGATVIGCHSSPCAGGIAGSCWKYAYVSGCYNIGKISVESSCSDSQCGGICGIVARNDNVTYSVSNCVSLEGKCGKAYNVYTQNSDYTGIPAESYETIGNAKINNVTIRNASAFANGEACWILNGDRIDTKWRQQIGKDTYPVWTGNYLVNYYNGSSSYYYNETMCEKSSNHIHNFEAATLTRCNNSKFTYWHCKECNKNYSYEGEGGYKNQTKELSQVECSTHILEWVPAVLPTSTTTGRYEHWHCTNCDKNFFDEQCTVEATEANLTVPVVKNNEIWYTTTNNQKMKPDYTNRFGAEYDDANSKYEKGLGVMIFCGDVTSIGNRTFYECSSLKGISIPSSVTNIEEFAFYDCSKLQSITIPGSVKGIGKDAFDNCSQLQSITIPGSVKGIGDNAFYECIALSTINILSGVAFIGNRAFAECSQLQSITIPGSVKSMGEYIFAKCTSLNNVTIEDGAYIGGRVFQDYNGMVTINGSLSGAGEYAFQGYTGLTSVSVKSDSIGKEAFGECKNLNKVTLDGVKSMEENVFIDCSSLKDVTIKDGTYIGANAFQNYKGVLTINGSLSGTGDNAFAGCTVLTSVSIKSGSIGSYAFQNCTSLSTVTMQEGVTSIGEGAFKNCPIQSIIIPGSVKGMGATIFSGCNSLNNVTIGDGAYIGVRVFQNYNGTVTINGSLSGAEEYAFQDCTGLTSVSVKSGSIGTSAFQGCTGLTSVSVKSGSIGTSAFQGCTGLTSVTLLEGVTDIGTLAFKGCTGLKDIFVKWTKAEKIPSIETNVFENLSINEIKLHVPSYTTDVYKAKIIWNSFKIVEDINVIITKTDDTKVEQKVVDYGSVTIDESEGDIKSLVVSEKLTNVSVTYIRNFANADKWQGWYLPFDVPVADMTTAGLDVAEIYGILLDNDNNAVIAFMKKESGTVKANTPYVVRPNKSGKVTLTTTTKLYQTVATSMFMMSIADTYTIGGIYEQTTTPGNWYAINKDGQFQKMGTGVNLRPFRIWMTIDPRDDNPYTQPSEANAKMDIMVIGDDETTGITSYENENDNDNGVIYNLNGQRVTSIQKGQIYIKDGKKYLAR